ncbi:hypothetical protein [Jongsikchunia kroppenstedtii]|uniref:hypothetical protein n=1 Tax=Jongsikchunia kroppenstedtii TaxID=1121721 RepID=UPI0003707071|nr:hypothetical protein [Jongsikchunia kroppenstedtii]
MAVLLIPFAVMAFALGMERLQSHLDGGETPDTEAGAAASAATVREAPVAAPQTDTSVHEPGPGTTGHLRFAS